MTKVKQIALFISLSFMLAVSVVMIPFASSNVGAASYKCKCSVPAPTSRTVAPTCTAKGYRETYCTKCGGNLAIKYTNALRHDETSKTIKYPTCNAYGQRRVTCKRAGCKYSEIKTIPVYGNHSYLKKTTKAPTCGTKGISVTYCRYCKKKESTTVLPATGKHSCVIKTIKEPRCNAYGQRKKNCTRAGCKYSVIETIPVYGNHSYVKKITKAPTCGTRGVEVTYCKYCNKKESTTLIPATGNHSCVIETIKEPRCNAYGQRKKTCTRAGCKYSAIETIPVYGNHSYVKKITKTPTCGTRGVEVTYCKYCNKKESTTLLPATGNHNPCYRELKAPTCKTTGSFEYYCNLCNKTLGKKGILPIRHTGHLSYHYGLDYGLKYGISNNCHLVHCDNCNAYFGEAHEMEINLNNTILDAVNCKKCNCDLIYAETTEDLMNNTPYYLGGSDWKGLLDAMISPLYDSGLSFEQEQWKTILEALFKEPIDEKLDEFIKDLIQLQKQSK